MTNKPSYLECLSGAYLCSIFRHQGQIGQEVYSNIQMKHIKKTNEATLFLEENSHNIVLLSCSIRVDLIKLIN